jgi:hypothetical protein
MKKFLTILFSGYFLIGAIVLPNSDFALLSSLQNIYDDFVKLNGKTCFSCFLDEQFVEGFELFDADNDNVKDNHHEKEQKPVPINCYLAQQSSAFKIQNFDIHFSEPTPVVEHMIFYQNFYQFATQVYIFHPPRNMA